MVDVSATDASPSPAAAAPEWWERVAARWSAWRLSHASTWTRLCRAYVIALWVGLLVLLVALVFSDTYRRSVQVVLSCLLLLAWWHLLARTKTLSWRAVSLLLTASLFWAPVVAWVTTLVSERAAQDAGYSLTAVGMPGAGTAVAGFGEEALKLVPLLVLVVAAPGRVRRFATVDWLLAGFACGLGFQLFEDMARRVAAAARRPGLLDILLGTGQGPGSGYPQYGLGPLSGGSSQRGLVDAAYAGHHVFTALVAAGVGLGIACWHHARSVPTPTGPAWRALGCAAPVGLFWLVAVDHYGYNATIDTHRWASPGAGREPTTPALVRWTWELTGHGAGRGWLLLLLLVAAVLVDARRLSRLPAPGGVHRPGHDLLPAWVGALGRTATGGAGRGLSVLRDAMVVVGSDIAVVLAAHRRGRGDDGGVEPRRNAAARGAAAAAMTRAMRREEFDLLAERRLPRSGVVAARRRVRLGGVAALVAVLVVAFLFAPFLAEQVGTGLTRAAGSGWLAGLLDSLGSWWDGLGAGEKLAVVVLLGAVAGLATGGLGSALFVAGIGQYTLTHAHGMATFTRDPRAATRDYVTTRTPQGAVVDALDFLLTFLPTGSAALVGHQAHVAAGAFARDPDAWRAALRVQLREASDAGTVRFDELGRKRAPTWPEIVDDWIAGRRFNAAQWHRYDVNEVTLSNGKRLDSYTPGEVIVSRKNSQLADLEPSTATEYLRELIRKYSAREVVADTPSARENFPHLIGQKLEGKYVLEVPVQRRDIPDHLVRLARELRIEIRDVTGKVHR